MSADASELVNEHVAAKALGLSVKTLRRWRWAGKGVPHCKFGSAVRYSRLDIAEYISRSRRQSTSDHGGDTA